MAGIDIFTDPTGVDDIVFNNRLEWRWTKDTTESLAQRIKIRLETWMGEWSFNTIFGTPYEQRILAGGLSKDQLDAEIRRVILLEDDVTAVQNIISRFDPASRLYVVDRVEVLHDNVITPIPIASPVEQLNTYPTPRTIDDFEICELPPTASLDSVNRLHVLINQELQQGGVNTWFREWTTDFSDNFSLESVNTLHRFINRDLQDGGSSSWEREY